jgi:hypothetical protein
MEIGTSGGLGYSTPSSESVRSELNRILASAQFQSSERLRRFLQFIVLRALDGEGDQLKEYRIGVEVFDRSSSYDPRLDPVVRLEARRLRAKLKAYYEGEGQRDPLRIEVPKGGYVPCFVAATWSGVAPSGDVAGPAGERSRKRRSLISLGWKRTLAAAAVLLSAALVAGGFYYRSRQAERLTDKDTIILADFANSTGDPVFDDTLKTALTVSLQQSPFLIVVSEQKATATLQSMTLPRYHETHAQHSPRAVPAGGQQSLHCRRHRQLGQRICGGIESGELPERRHAGAPAGDGRFQEECLERVGNGGVHAAWRTGRVAGYRAEI